MKIVVLYHPQSDHGGLVADYVTEFQSYKKKPIELVSLESIKGADLAELYGINQYPAFLVITDNGSLLRLWQGLPLPLMDELSYYVGEPQEAISRVGHIMALHPA